MLEVYIDVLLISWRIYDYLGTNMIFSTPHVTLVNKLMLTKTVKILKYINKSIFFKKRYQIGFLKIYKVLKKEAKI